MTKVTCHCGAIELRVTLSDGLNSARRCDCSFCRRRGAPAEVDAVAAALKDAGHVLTVDPWDAFWGQRYATVKDPDGYQIDISAEL